MNNNTASCGHEKYYAHRCITLVIMPRPRKNGRVPGDRPPTIRDVADAAKVHHATVSRALKNDPRISAETHRRVADAAARLGYLKNPLVSAHMAQVRMNRPTSEHGVLGFLLPYSDRRRWLSGYHRLLTGAQDRASALGYRIEVFGYADPDVNLKTLERIFRTRAIYGLLLCPLYEGDPKLDLNWSRYALAQMSSHSVTPELHLSTTHPFDTVRACLEQLASLGYRRIGMHVEKKIDVQLHGEWSAAVILSQQHLPPSHRVPPLLQETLDETDFTDWVEKHQPDAVLSKHYRALRWLRKMKLRVPGDIGFAHLDWRSDFGRCAGLRQHVHIVAAMAVDLVVEQLHHNDRGVPKHAKTLLVKGEWVRGATVRKLRQGVGA